MPRTLYGIVKAIGMLAALASAILPCAASTSTPDLIVWENVLNSGWVNWSWGATVATVASPVRSGTNSLAVTYTSAWGGLYLAANQAFAPAPYDTLQFWVHGGARGAQKVRVVLADASYNLLSNYAVAITVTAGVWTQVKILLSDLGDPGQIGGVVWQDAGGGAQPTYYLDAICFTNQGIPPPPPGPGPDLSVDAAAGRHAISDKIYGMNFADESLAAALRIPVRRWGAPSQKIGLELGAHKRSCPDLKRLTMFAMLSPDLSAVRVQHRTRVCPDSSNSNEVRIQRRASVRCVSANPNE